MKTATKKQPRPRPVPAPADTIDPPPVCGLCHEQMTDAAGFVFSVPIARQIINGNVLRKAYAYHCLDCGTPAVVIWTEE